MGIRQASIMVRIYFSEGQLGEQYWTPAWNAGLEEGSVGEDEGGDGGGGRAHRGGMRLPRRRSWCRFAASLEYAVSLMERICRDGIGVVVPAPMTCILRPGFGRRKSTLDVTVLSL